MQDQNETENEVTVDELVKTKAKTLQLKAMYAIENTVNQGKYGDLTPLTQLLGTLQYIGD